MRLGVVVKIGFWLGAGALGLVGVAAVALTTAMLAMSLAAPASAAGPKWPGPWPVEVLAVKDGDTIDVHFTAGPCGRGPCPGSEASIRVRGIDAPEVHECRGGSKTGRGKTQSCAQCPEELALGARAKARAIELLDGRQAVRIRDIGPDAYNGRYVATIEVLTGDGWESYGAIMLREELAVRYDPEADRNYRKLKPWCTRDRPAEEAAGPAPIEPASEPSGE